jgi:zinc transport system ATP-binding protein
MIDNIPLPDDFLVCLDNAGVQSGLNWLVRGVNLTVRRGEIVTLIGPNGSGKTTTAKLALGLIVTHSGSVWRAPKLKIGYVPQRLYTDSTLPLSVSRLMRLTRWYSDEDVTKTLTETGVGDLCNHQVHQLSGGELQRVLLARAIIGAPDLLVLDEPVQGVDFTGGLALYDLIDSIRERTGCGILLISHDLHVVMAKTNTVVCLNGHVCCTGTPSSVANNPEYLRLFGQRAVDAIAIYRHHHDHVHLSDGRVKHADGNIAGEYGYDNHGKADV